MIENLKIEDVLFLDIETVPQYPEYKNLPDKIKPLWDKKAIRLVKSETETPEELYSRAGIYAEFGKIICISTGIVYGNTFRVKSFFGDDEKILLDEFAGLLNGYYNQTRHLLCGHNGKEFDFPYIARRMLVHGITLPKILNLHGKKPWEIPHLDTMELWRFGDYKSYTSLELLTAIFGIPSPKDNIDGSMVGKVYWEEKNLEKIVEYCQKDTLAVAQILLRYMGRPLIEEENVVIP
ncbi:MAG: 3'-5' exonuclease [Bacteroidales bacterium]|nr:3'-5' exonuclease [Bacteroidales bacterium]